MDSEIKGPLLQSPKINFISYWKFVPIDILSIIVDYLDKVEDIYKFCSDPSVFEKIGKDENNNIWKNKFQRDLSQEIKLDNNQTIMSQYLRDFKPIPRYCTDLIIEKGYEKLMSRTTYFNDISYTEMLSEFNRACQYGHLSVVKYFMEDSSFSYVCCNNKKAFLISIHYGHLSIVNYLLNVKDNNFNIKDIDTGFIKLVIKLGHLSILRFLIENLKYPINFDEPNDFLFDLFSEACRYNRLSIVEYLISRGTYTSTQKNYALQISVSNNCLSIVKFLNENGADIHFENEVYLDLACKCGYLPIVQYLIENGADIHAGFQRALNSAVLDDHFNIVEYLVEKGANIQKCIFRDRPILKKIQHQKWKKSIIQ